MLPKILTRTEIEALIALLIGIVIALAPDLREPLIALSPLLVTFLVALIGVPAIERTATAYLVMRARALEAELLRNK